MSTADIQSNMVVAESSRAVQRKQRQLAIEMEQRLEEAEALKTLLTDVSFFSLFRRRRAGGICFSVLPQVQHETKLASSFSAVKTEFSDLDGKAWTNTLLGRCMQVPGRQRPAKVNTLSLSAPSSASENPHSIATARIASTPLRLAGTSAQFAVLTNSELQHEHDVEDTIRVSKTRLRYRGRMPSSGTMAKDPVCQALFPSDNDHRLSRPGRIEGRPPLRSVSDSATVFAGFDDATPMPSPQGSPASMFRFAPPLPSEPIAASSPSSSALSESQAAIASNILARARGRKRSRSPVKNVFKPLADSLPSVSHSTETAAGHNEGSVTALGITI
ncbi:hypothetical protein HGRIS_004974 [Hohenbuehelia grisea]|uniref:Uncharacterized protein n=1 Tax=Hohenbuehelia grisea TaxID=104357 RepID=A0ABR3JE73_9AGAR